MLFDDRIAVRGNDVSKMDIVLLIQLDFTDFLAEFVRRNQAPSEFILGVADVSPESAAAGRHPDSWAYRLFAPEKITDHREFDRAALGLKYLHAALTGDRAQFPISDRNYDRIRAWLDRSITSSEDLNAWCWALLFNDLGKLRVVSERYAGIHGGASADHDQVMVGVLRDDPGFIPGVDALPNDYREALIEGLATGFNLGKAAQLECPDVAWADIGKLPPFVANFHFGHSFFDFLGVTGAIDPVAAKPFILNDHNVEAYLGVIEQMDPARYAFLRLEQAGIDKSHNNRSFARLVGMARVFDKEGGQRLTRLWDGLPAAVQAILDCEFGVSGTAGVIAIEPHYGPALLANAATAARAVGLTVEDGWSKALVVMSRILFEARRLVGYGGRSGANGLAIANMADVATLIAREGLAAIDQVAFILIPSDDGFRVRVDRRSVIEPTKFATAGLGDLCSGRRAVFVGIGGGSDCLQAAQLALESSAAAACVISVRTAITASEGASGKTGEDRTVVQHGGEIVPGVFRILPEATGSGRFLENLPADRLPVYLVLDRLDGQLLTQITAALDDFGGAEVLVAVDTGGDALHRVPSASGDPADAQAPGQDAVRSTPDQDLRVLETLNGLSATRPGMSLLTIELAVGVDSPDYAEAILQEAAAKLVSFDEAVSRRILARYAEWRSKVSGGWLGKTPLAWSKALNGEYGFGVLDIPVKRVVDQNNPWNPFVQVDVVMAGGFVMAIADHMAAISRKPD